MLVRFFFSSRRRHTRCSRDWSSDVCSSDLRFVADRRKRSVSQLDLGDLAPLEVLAFLEHLETNRHNLAATRNVRLAAIHAFFRYCATADPARVEHCQRVLAIPFKRTGSRPIQYLEYDEIQAVLASVDLIVFEVLN